MTSGVGSGGAVVSAGDAQAAFILQVHPRAPLLFIAQRGVWPEELGKRYLEGFQELLPRLQRPWVCVADLRGLPPQSTGVRETRRIAFEWVVEHGMFAVANVTDTTFSRLQMRRVATDVKVTHFESFEGVTAALAWLSGLDAELGLQLASVRAEDFQTW